MNMNINTPIYKLIEIYFPESRLLKIPIDREYLDYYIYVDERDNFSCIKYYGYENRIMENYIKDKKNLLDVSIDKLLAMKIHRNYYTHYPELKLEKDVFFDILHHLEILARKSSFNLD